MEPSEVRQLIDELELYPSSKLGQVFIANEKIIQTQLEAAALTSKDTVLEVGPGLGALTYKLADHAGHVIAVEYDNKLYNYLGSRLPDNVQLIHGDALKIKLPEFNKIVANIPYQISSPLIFKLTEYDFELAVFMFQAEFAMRLLPSWVPIPEKYRQLIKYLKQSPKKNSRLTIMASYHFDIEYISSVPKTSFVPVPKVDSALIKLSPRKQMVRADNKELFANLVRIVFSERRKMIKNSISKKFKKLLPGLKKYSKVEVTAIIEKIPYQHNRPEELTLDDFILLANKIDELLNHQ